MPGGFRDLLNKRTDIRAEILDRLILETEPAERERLREMASMQQERYLAVADTVEKIKKQCFNPVNSAAVACSEALSVTQQRNINTRLTTVRGRDGTAERLELARPPATKSDAENGEINPNTRDYQRELGINEKVIYMPNPLTDDKAIAAAIKGTLHDHNLYLTIPSRDGFEGAAFDMLDVGRDVLKKAAADDNLRTLPPGRRRRLQLLFDKMGWSSQKPMTRWTMRTPDTKTSHNAVRYGKDMMTLTVDDCHQWMDMAVSLIACPRTQKCM